MFSCIHIQEFPVHHVLVLRQSELIIFINLTLFICMSRADGVGVSRSGFSGEWETVMLTRNCLFSVCLLFCHVLKFKFSGSKTTLLCISGELFFWGKECYLGVWGWIIRLPTGPEVESR